MKHIERKQSFIKDLWGIIKLKYCHTDEMKPDILTKLLGTIKHHRFSELLRLRTSESYPLRRRVTRTMMSPLILAAYLPI